MFTKLRSRQKGSLFVGTLVIILLVGITAIGLLSFVSAMHRQGETMVAMEKADWTAEAGLHLLIHYSLYRADTPNGVRFHRHEQHSNRH